MSSATAVSDEAIPSHPSSILDLPRLIRRLGSGMRFVFGSARVLGIRKIKAACGLVASRDRRRRPSVSFIGVSVSDSLFSTTTGRRDGPVLEAAALQQLTSRGWQPDHVAARRRSDLGMPTQDDALVALAAARLGTTRLIDNLEFEAHDVS